MRVALIDSGCGLLATAGWLRHLRADLDLDLFLDPEGMPWGPKDPRWLVDRVLATGRQAVERGADAIVVPCNTASVTAIVPLRAAIEPDRPVVATVPAVKPAAATGEPFAVWATEGTTGSDYQRSLLELFAARDQAETVACAGLADAVERADAPAVEAAVRRAAARTPSRCRAVVLGCTHYPLVDDVVSAALPAGTILFDSSRAVAGQTLRRMGLAEAPGTEPAGVRVFLSGDPGELPIPARAYPVGAALALAGPVPAEVLPWPREPRAAVAAQGEAAARAAPA